MGTVRVMRLMSAGVLMLTSPGPPALMQQDVEPGSRAEATRIVAEMRSAHDIVNEEPGKVLLSLVQHARPIAERAGDIPPP